MENRPMPLAYPLLTYGAPLSIDYVDQIDTADAGTTIRSYFPETWLWELVYTGSVN